MSASIPVNPEVLRWARQSLDMSIDDVAARLKKSPEVLEAWERGEGSPTYVQLETLAYDIYKRPLALFFFPEPPDEETAEQSFRTLPEFELERIPPRIHYLLRKARVFQDNLSELHDGSNPADRNVLRDLHFTPQANVESMAGMVRTYFGVDLAEQFAWDNSDSAFKVWRNVFEDHGVFIFKDSFNAPGRKRDEDEDSPFSGFCLYDVEFPIIYVNNNKAKTRQIFTLFHELAHLLMKTGGVDTRHDDYIAHLKGDAKRIEILCNRFAAEFLVPTYDFGPRVSGQRIVEEQIVDWADLYCVSREVILRRCLDRGDVTQSYYESMARKWAKERVQRKGGSGNHFLTQGAYLGQRYVEKVFSQYHKNRITLEQAADFLGEKANNVPKMEDWLFRQGMSA